MPDSRKKFLDILRIAAICMVVFMHTVTGAVDILDVKAYLQYRIAVLLIMDLITWCVPVLLMISGYLFLNPLRKADFRTILKKNCRRVILALFLFGVPFGCLEWIAVNRSVRPEMVRDAFLMVLRGQGWAHMWYLYLILFLYLLTPFLRKILSLLPRYVAYVGMGILFALCSATPFLNKVLGGGELLILPILPETAIYLFYYLCGYFMVTGKAPYIMGERAFRGFLLILLSGVLAGIIYSRCFGGFSLQMAYNYPPTVILSILIMWVAMKMEGKFVMEGGHAMERERPTQGQPAMEKKRPMEPRGKQKTRRYLQCLVSFSFTIYLIHPLFLNIFYKLLGYTPFDFPIYFSLPFFFTATFVLSVLAAWILGKISILNKYVL